ncbi:MAG: nucleotide-binding protein [Planctomycetota bacterium]
MSGDQAQRLRQRAGHGSRTSLRLPALAVTGGKGGIGKTCVAVHLALALQRAGKRVLLVDCDLGMANADVLLGLNPQRSLFQVLSESLPMEEAVISHGSGLDLLPAASGRDEMTHLDHGQWQRLLDGLSRLGQHYDLLVLDTAAGIHKEVIDLIACAQLVLAVLTPDPTALTDAYALIKVLEQRHPGRAIELLVNQTNSDDEGVRIANRMGQVARNYLQRDCPLLGHIPADRAIRAAVRARKPLPADDQGPANRAITGLARKLAQRRWRT